MSTLVRIQPLPLEGKARLCGSFLWSGESKAITYTIDARGPWSLAFKTPQGGNAQQDLRFTSVRSTAPVLTRAGQPGVRETSNA